nr:hypothetical protein [Tanacetum cinerariifolium]
MYFLLSSMSFVYMLTTPIPEDGENATMDQIRKRNKWDNDDYVCRGLILNGMSDPLSDIYQNVESSETIPVMGQYNELLGILRRFTQLKINMNEAIQVSCIIDKLPPSWKDFKHILKHQKKELTLFELGSRLRVEESLIVYTNNRGKCGKVGNKANGSSTNGSVDGSTNSLKGQNMFNKSLQAYYATYVSEAYFVQDDDVAWLVDSGATVHVCKDRCRFKTYESLNDGYILHMGNESTALVHGHSCVDIRFSSRKIVSLFNVLYVPNMRKNLVSMCILNNCGYKQVIESYKFVLSKHDWVMSTLRG